MAFSSAAVSLCNVRNVHFSFLSKAYKSSTRYGAEEKDVFNPTFIDGDAETHIEWRYVVANNAPVKPHGKVKSPILSTLLNWQTTICIRNAQGAESEVWTKQNKAEPKNLTNRQRESNLWTSMMME